MRTTFIKSKFVLPTMSINKFTNISYSIISSSTAKTINDNTSIILSETTVPNEVDNFIVLVLEIR